MILKHFYNPPTENYTGIKNERTLPTNGRGDQERGFVRRSESKKR